MQVFTLALASDNNPAIIVVSTASIAETAVLVCFPLRMQLPAPKQSHFQKAVNKSIFNMLHMSEVKKKKQPSSYLEKILLSHILNFCKTVIPNLH